VLLICHLIVLNVLTLTVLMSIQMFASDPMRGAAKIWPGLTLLLLISREPNGITLHLAAGRESSDWSGERECQKKNQIR
jgi:hypothetical protein